MDVQELQSGTRKHPNLLSIPPRAIVKGSDGILISVSKKKKLKKNLVLHLTEAPSKVVYLDRGRLKSPLERLVQNDQRTVLKKIRVFLLKRFFQSQTLIERGALFLEPSRDPTDLKMPISPAGGLPIRMHSFPSLFPPHRVFSREE